MRVARGLSAILLLVACGCDSGGFGLNKVKDLLEPKPLQLDAEQVMLTQAQVDCGVRADLWEAPISSGERMVARLTEKGRAAKFTDDVVISSAFAKPVTQVRGQFNLAVFELVHIKDEPGAKLVEARVGVYVNHSCFNGALPMMGVRRGDFTPDAPATFRFVEEGGWHLDRIVH